MIYNIHDENTAPAPSAALLRKVKEKYGFVPNLLGTMAGAPALLKGYMTLSGIFDETSFNETEKQVILLSVSRVNGCAYCMAAHSAAAGMQGISEETVQALRNDAPIPDARLEALRVIARDIAETRGYPSEKNLRRFLDAGYTSAQVLEVVLGVGLKTLSNYTNHIAETPLDEAFRKTAWQAQV